MKLELKHLAPYLPYELKIKLEKSTEIITVNGLCSGGVYGAIGGYTVIDKTEGYYHYDSNIYGFKPILRPLSDLTKEIELNENLLFVPMEKIKFANKSMARGVGRIDFNEVSKYGFHPLSQPYWAVENLFRWHFDVFGLIQQGLAIDVNTLSNTAA